MPRLEAEGMVGVEVMFCCTGDIACITMIPNFYSEILPLLLQAITWNKLKLVSLIAIRKILAYSTTISWNNLNI